MAVRMAAHRGRRDHRDHRHRGRLDHPGHQARLDVHPAHRDQVRRGRPASRVDRDAAAATAAQGVPKDRQAHRDHSAHQVHRDVLDRRAYWGLPDHRGQDVPGEAAHRDDRARQGRRGVDSHREASLFQVGLLAVRAGFPLAVVVVDHARPGVAECLRTSACVSSPRTSCTGTLPGPGHVNTIGNW